MYWTPLSINYLIEFILIIMVAGHFTYRLIMERNTWQESRSTGFLALATFGGSASTLLQLLSISLHPSYGNLILPWVGPAGATGMAGFLLFSYYFLSPSGLGKWGGFLLVMMLASLVIFELYIATHRWILVRSGIVEYREAWVDIPFAAGFGFSFVFFAAHLAKAISQDRRISIWFGLWRALGTIVWPSTKLTGEAAAARGFFYVSAMPLFLGISLLLRSYGLIDWLTAELLVCWFFLLTVASFALSYLNYIPEQSSFRVKIIGVTLITMLSILCGISWVVGSVYIDGFKNNHIPLNKTAFHFAPKDFATKDQGRYQISSADYVFEAEIGHRINNATGRVDLPFSFPFFEVDYQAVFIRESGIIGFHHLPLWRDVENQFGPQPAIYAITAALIENPVSGSTQSGLFYKQEPNRVTFTWNKLVSPYHPDDEYAFQIRLHRNGSIDMVFKDVPQELTPDIYRAFATPMMTGIVPAFQNRDVAAIRFSSDLPFEASAGQGVMEYYRLDFLTYLDRIYAPIAYFIFASCLGIFFIFPRFFRINLDLPLKQLIWAVQQIMDGKLATEIRVTHRDEIGFLALSFKKMARAQFDLIQTLEEKVAQRTLEATEYAAMNARLEERNRISRDLHDAVSQTLFSANLIAGTLSNLIEKDPKQGQSAVEDIQRLNKEALREMRQVLLELRPENLTALPLGLLLQNLTNEIRNKFSVDVFLKIEGDAVLPDAVQLTIYRIAQESLTNAAKHACASQIEMVFDGMETQAMLSISDDGIGFDTAMQKPGHMGLQIMKERIGDVGGSLEISSQPDHGCQVTAIWFDNNVI